ncbi:hypothetical protein HDU92_004151 [Lobulomyces angularis]|nr:hypothetical protein HDU92_004151 [Lobulomyces angularis]
MNIEKPLRLKILIERESKLEELINVLSREGHSSDLLKSLLWEKKNLYPLLSANYEPDVMETDEKTKPLSRKNKKSKK